MNHVLESRIKLTVAMTTVKEVRMEEKELSLRHNVMTLINSNHDVPIDKKVEVVTDILKIMVDAANNQNKASTSEHIDINT